MNGRLAIFAHSPGLSGAERSLLETLPILAGRFALDLFVPGPGPFAERARALARDLPLEVLETGHRFDYGHDAGTGPRAVAHGAMNLRAFLRARARLTRHRPVAIYSNSVASWLGARLARTLDLPHLWHLRELPLASSIGRPRAGARAEAALLRRGAHLANSAFVADWYRARHGIAPQVAYQPVSLRPLPPVADPEGRLRILSVGRLKPQKGHDRVIDALSQGPAHARLTIVGEGSQQEALAARIARSGLGDRVHLAGGLPDLAEPLARADLLVTAATDEAFGRVTAEAMLAGVPVIGLRSGGTAELLAGGRGTLVDPGDRAALAAALGAFAADPAPFQAMAARARDWARATLSHGAYGATVLGALDGLLPRGDGADG